MSKVFKLLGLIFICVSLQGCLVTAVGAGVGAVMYGKSKEKDSATKCKDSYTQYVKVEQQMKQKPMTLEQYCK